MTRAGDRGVTDDRYIADGYRMFATTPGMALDTHLFPEPGRPLFVEVNTPFRRDRRWSGDNTDAYYCTCPVAIVRDDDPDIDASGDFSFELGPVAMRRC